MTEISQDPPYWTLYRTANWIAFGESADLFPFTYAAYWEADNPEQKGRDAGMLDDAEHRLKHALQAGDIVAHGHKNGARYATAIPLDYWISAQFDWIKQAADSIDRYENLRFDRVRVRALWPATKARTTVAAERRCQNWLKSMMDEGPPEKLKPEYRTEAREKFDIGVRAFDRAWAHAVAESGNTAWKTPGPKSKQTIRNTN